MASASFLKPLFQAFKSVSWSKLAQNQVLSEVASSLVKSVASRKRTSAPAEPAGAAPAGLAPTEQALLAASVRMQSLEGLVSQLQAETRSSTQLLQSLVQESTKLGEAIQVLRARTQVLSVACVVLVVIGAIGWFFPLAKHVA